MGLFLNISNISKKGKKVCSILTSYIAQWSKQGSSSQAGVYVSIQGNALFHDNGRYFFILIKTLASSFSNVAISRFSLADCYRMGSYGRNIFSISNLIIDNSLPAERKNKLLIYDRSLSKSDLSGWRSCVRIETDISLAKPGDAPWTLMPYCMHPKMYTLFGREEIQTLRRSDRNLCLFFSGNVNPSVYSGRGFWRKARFDLMPRVQIIDAIKSNFEDAIAQVDSQDTLAALLTTGANRKKIVLGNSQRLYIQHKDWLPLLARCNFFICPPGIDMPLCHNAIEAMAVGTIPLINYPHWFSPSLQDLHTCISYRTEPELIEKVNLIGSMPAAQIAEIRKNVIHYYETHLAFDGFYQRLNHSNHPHKTLFVNTGNRDILKHITPTSVIWG